MFLEFARFLESPSRATYLAARSAWLRLSMQPLHPAELTELAARLAQGDTAGVIATAHDWKSRGALSPRVHYLTAEAHTVRGETEQAELERWVFSTCLQGILATGDGTRKKPFVIAQLTDEYDVLKLHGLECEQQRLVQRGRRTCDVLACSDGSEVWFEINALMRVPAEALPSKIQVELPAKAAGITRTTRRTSGRLRTSRR
jgi:hypothetical protein